MVNNYRLSKPRKPSRQVYNLDVLFIPKLHANIYSFIKFQDVINSLWPTNDKGEENFMEAVKNAHLAYTKVALPQCVEEVFSDPMIERVVVDPSLESINPVSFKFWVIARAIKQFTENEGKLFLLMQHYCCKTQAKMCFIM